MELQERILNHLAESSKPVESEALAKALNEDHQKIVGGIKSLECIANLIQAEILTVKQWHLTSEGQRVVQKGSHEAVVYQALPKDGSGITKADLMKTVSPEEGKIGFSKALQKGWIFIDKSDGGLVKRKLDSITDIVHKDLSSLQHEANASNVPENSLTEYKKRKLVEEKTTKRYVIKKGEQFKTKIEKATTELTADMIANGEWKTANFKPYNFEALGIQPQQVTYIHY